MNEAEATEKVMALVIKLHLDDMQPWPRRKRVAELTGVSLPMLDTVMSRLQETGQITIWTATRSGNRSPDVTVQKFVQPSQDALNGEARPRVDRHAPPSPHHLTVHRPGWGSD